MIKYVDVKAPTWVEVNEIHAALCDEFGGEPETVGPPLWNSIINRYQFLVEQFARTHGGMKISLSWAAGMLLNELVRKAPFKTHMEKLAYTVFENLVVSRGGTVDATAEKIEAAFAEHRENITFNRTANPFSSFANAVVREAPEPPPPPPRPPAFRVINLNKQHP